jgi:hypothetical protein
MNIERRKAFRQTLLTLGVFLILVTLAGAVHKYRASWALQEYLNEVAAQGYPIALIELNDWYLTPPLGENAADYYVEAFKVLNPSPMQRKEPGFAGGPPFSFEAMRQAYKQTSEKAVTEWLDDNEAALALLYEGAKLQQCRYPVDMSDGHELDLPHLPMIEESVQLLRVDALRHQHEGRPEESAKALVAALALVDSLRYEPTVLAQRTRHAQYMIVQNAVRNMAIAHAVPPHAARIVTDALLATPGFSSKARSLATERVAHAALVDDASKRYSDYDNEYDGSFLRYYLYDLLVPLRALAYDYLGFRELDALYLSQALHELTLAFEKPIDEQYDALMAAKPMLDEAPDILWVSADELPAYFGVRDWESVVQQERNFTAADVAAKSFRATEGRTATSIEALVPKYINVVPIDPLTGAPIVIETNEQ